MNFSNKISSPPSIHKGYRPDIDGLRALAVIAVVVFHASPTTLRGGFVGVDIFFVISGFLITSIILNGLINDRFTFTDFYFRRARRIFPALSLVLAACFVFGWFILMADEYMQLGKHIAAGAGFISNFMLWSEVGYFDNAAETKPLLHLWSLGIEEQFYFIWPLLLWFAWKKRLNSLYITFVVVLLSFIACVVILNTNPTAAFFAPWTRFWELCCGAALAHITTFHHEWLSNLKNKANSCIKRIVRRNSRDDSAETLNHILSTIGLLLLIASFIAIHKGCSFPGWLALLPVIGSLFIIVAGQQAIINRRILSSKVLVWFGLISYPLYLWHWPLLSFVRIVEGEKPGRLIRWGAVAVAIVLSWLTYKLVENPLRFGRFAKQKALHLMAAIVLLGFTGIFVFQQDGIKSRESVKNFVETEENLSYSKHFEGWENCPDTSGSKDCKILDPSRPPDILLIGDSHAGHSTSGLAEIYNGSNSNIIAKFSPGCFPFFQTSLNGKDYFVCKENYINQALESAINTPSIKIIIMAGYANLMIRNDRGYLRDKPQHDEYVSVDSKHEIDGRANAFREAMFTTLEKLTASEKKIHFIVDIPELYFDPKDCISFRNFTFSNKQIRRSCAIERAKFENRTSEYHQILSEAKLKFPNVKFINTYDYLCDTEKCDVLIGNKLIYSTRDHLSAFGSRYLFGKMKNEMLAK